MSATGTRMHDVGTRCRQPHDQRGIQGDQKLEQVRHHAETHGPDGIGHGPGHADGGKHHDDIGELEHGFRQAAAKRKHRTPFFVAQQRQGNAKNHAEDHDLKHLALGHRFGDVLRENLQDNVAGFFRLGRRQRRGGGRLRDSDARLGKVDRRQSNEERQRGDHLKIQQGLDAHASDLLQIGVAGDSDHQGAENQWRDNGLDQRSRPGDGRRIFPAHAPARPPPACRRRSTR